MKNQRAKIYNYSDRLQRNIDLVRASAVEEPHKSISRQYNKLDLVKPQQVILYERG